VSSLVEFPGDMIKELYTQMDLATHLCFAGTCKKFYYLSKIILPRDVRFNKKKWEFILERALDSRIWKTKGWLSFDAFGTLYDELFFSFERTGRSLNKFLGLYRKTFKVSHRHIWNLSSFGPAPGKYLF
jgi:hypothetical protein